MSYILDALKKVEREKNRKNRPDGRVSISGDLFHDRSRPAARAGVWKIVALVAAASLVTSAGTWFVIRGKSKKSAAVIRAAAPPTPAPVNPPVVAPPVPVPPAPVPVQSQAAPVPVPPAAPSTAAPVSPTSAGPDEDEDEESSSRSARRSRTRVKTQPPSPKQSAQSVQPPADITLSGIAWQDERAARRAVINGFLLKEGAVVSGARIIDIQTDRVRFSSAAGQFEIKLNSVLPAEVKK